MRPLTRQQVLNLQPIERLGPRLGGVAISGAVPFVTSAGARPLAEAILFRVFKAIPRTVRAESYARLESLVTSQLLLKDFVVRGQPMTRWEWIKSISVSRRRKILVKAMHDLDARGCYHKNFDKISPFVKTEPLLHGKQTPDGVFFDQAVYIARLIQAPHDETHLVAGPYLKPITRRLKEVWNWDNWIFYASVCPEKLNLWLRKNRYAISYFWSDYSAFDATWSAPAWRVVEGLYARIYPDAELDFWKVLEIWRRPRGSAKCRKDNVKMSYQADVCNASGRDDTALANALLNGLVLALSFAAALANKRVWEVTEEDLAVASRLVNISIVGDDSLVACCFEVAEYASAVEQGIRDFGLIVKAQHSSSLADVTFLGMMPYPTRHDIVWGPTVFRRLFKAFWQTDPTGHLPAWTHGVAKQLSLMRSVPILYDLSVRVLELLKGTKITEVVRDENRAWTFVTEEQPLWDDVTVAWMCHRYRRTGLTPEMFRRDVALIRRISRLPCVIELETMFAPSVEDET